MPDHLPKRSRIVHEALRAAGVDGEIRELPDSTRTAAEAATALDCEVGAIASSLVFRIGDEALLVMTSGAHRVDTDLLAANLGVESIDRASPDFVRTVTGQSIGGVAPTGHPAPIRTVIDEDLRRFDPLWAAGGTPNTVFPLGFDELVALTGGTVLTVSADPLA